MESSEKMKTKMTSLENDSPHRSPIFKRTNENGQFIILTIYTTLNAVYSRQVSMPGYPLLDKSTVILLEMTSTLKTGESRTEVKILY